MNKKQRVTNIDFDVAFDTRKWVLENLRERDFTAIVLKGHLVIEELLYQLVKRAARHPNHLEDAGLGFFQLAHLARALARDDAKLDSVWGCILALNTLRNTLAHSLHTERLETNLRAFARSAPLADFEFEQALLANPANEMKSCITGICLLLHDMVLEIKKGRTK